ncbi:MAG TPA: hypothetical protein VGQ69_06285 [Gemmatimonadales bacterium]|jgi:hypothetical protein|nr:hypothetical protein [Gemmatimonadales bacterium]
MSGFKMEQKRIVHRGREFHFVSYEAQLANPVKALPAQPAAWFLMQGGKRWMVMPLVRDQAPEAVDKSLIQWLESHVFHPASVIPS